MKRNNPDAKVTEISRMISELWKQLDESTIELYNQKHEEDKKRYEREVREYEEQYGPRENQISRKKKQPGSGEQELEENGSPKRMKRPKESEESIDDEKNLELYIKADINDADYICCTNPITMATVKSFLPLLRVIGRNGEWYYRGKNCFAGIDEDVIEEFGEFVPRSPDINTERIRIVEVQYYEVRNNVRLI